MSVRRRCCRSDVQIVDSTHDPGDGCRVVDGLRGRLQRQPGREESLDDIVVEVTGDPFAFIEQPGGAGLLVEAGVLDGQTRRGGQPDRELLIDVGEHLAVGFVGEVEVAVDDAAEPDRHAQERRHWRVAGREPEAVGMGVQIGEAQWLRVEDQQPEDAVALGTGSDAGRLVLAEADRDELPQPGPRLVQHPQRRVAGVDQLRTDLGDAPQRVGEGLLGSDRHHRVEQPQQLLRAGELEAVGHHRMLRPASTSVRGDDSHDFSGNTSLLVIRVFLLDDHEVVRRGVRDLLETADDLEVVGEAGTAAEAVQRVPATAPDVAVLDVRLPDGSGIEVCRDLRSLLPELRCLMLTSFNYDEALFDAVMAGASGYVLKEVRGAELIDSVRSVAAGRSLLDPLATARVLERIRNPPQDALTATLSPQETAILGHLADGLTNREIAAAMFLA